jgi:hypothetical protein
MSWHLFANSGIMRCSKCGNDFREGPKLGANCWEPLAIDREDAEILFGAIRRSCKTHSIPALLNAPLSRPDTGTTAGHQHDFTFNKP